jgi:hypothetical protein
MAKKSDPTKDPQFQNVVQHFLTTKPKPHKESAGNATKSTGAPRNKARKNDGSANQDS